MKRWEYLATYGAPWGDKLKKLGEEGWELVGVVPGRQTSPYKNEYDRGQWTEETLYFKREKTDE